MRRLLDGAGDDVRHAFRLLARERSFALVAAVTLALGIGCNTAVFSVLEAVVLGPLPYADPQRLTLILSAFQKMGAMRAPGSGTELRELQRMSHAYEGIAGIWVGNGTLTGGEHPEQMKVASVTWNFFDVLGARPALGRTFVAGEEGGKRGALIISDGLWRRRFGADPRLIGSAVRLDGADYTIVGVMPPGFRLYFSPDANVPAELPAFMAFPYEVASTPRDLFFIRFLGRLKAGVTVQQAQHELDSMAARLRERYMEYHAENLALQAVPLQRDVVREVRPVLAALMCGAGFVLLIACVNVANLLLARASARRKEIAVRASMGASRGRIIRQLLAENVALALAGGLLGAALGWVGTRVLTSFRPDSLSRLDMLGVDPVVFGFVAAISLGSVILFGLAPALEATKVNLVEALWASGRGARAPARKAVRKALVVAEITLGFILLTGAGLMMLTFLHLQSANPGFEAHGVLTFEIGLQGRRFESDIDRINFVREWESRLAALPGVESAGGISHLPLDNYPNWYSPWAPEGTSPEQWKNRLADYRAITPGYFAGIGARMLEGRTFTALDGRTSPRVVIVDDLLARAAWPNQSAVGKKITAEHFVDGNFADAPSVVVGVVQHVQHHSLAAKVRGQIYIPYSQSAREHLSFAVRVKSDPGGLASAVQRELAKMDKDLAPGKVRPMTDYVSRAAAPFRFTAMIAAVFGALALLLAATGVYSVSSYSIAQRGHEMAVRMAIGARRADILTLVMRESLVLAAVGIALGLIGAALLSRYVETLLFGVTPFDALTYMSVAATLAAVAVIATVRPALRASRESVADTLRLG